MRFGWIAAIPLVALGLANWHGERHYLAHTARVAVRSHCQLAICDVEVDVLRRNGWSRIASAKGCLLPKVDVGYQNTSVSIRMRGGMCPALDFEYDAAESGR